MKKVMALGALLILTGCGKAGCGTVFEVKE